RRFLVVNDHRLKAAFFQQRQCGAGFAAAGIVVNRDSHHGLPDRSAGIVADEPGWPDNPVKGRRVEKSLLFPMLKRDAHRLTALQQGATVKASIMKFL